MENYTQPAPSPTVAPPPLHLQLAHNPATTSQKYMYSFFLIFKKNKIQEVNDQLPLVSVQGPWRWELR